MTYKGIILICFEWIPSNESCLEVVGWPEHGWMYQKTRSYQYMMPDQIYNLELVISIMYLGAVSERETFPVQDTRAESRYILIILWGKNLIMEILKRDELILMHSLTECKNSLITFLTSYDYNEQISKKLYF